MKVCVFSPYFKDRITGGGEKHLLEMALVMAGKHQVFIAVSRPCHVLKDKEENLLKEYRQLYQNFLRKDLSSLTFIFTPLMTTKSSLCKLWWTRQFDYLLAVTDGSLFFSLAKTNNLHFQVPFIHRKLTFIDKLKLSNWQVRNANSLFTKKAIEKSWGITIQHLVYPLIELDNFEPLVRKQKIILSVGRFFRHLHAKRQDVLIDAFKSLIKKFPTEFKGWQLVLMGAPEDEEYVKHLKQKSRGLPIVFKTIVSRQELVGLMNKSKIFWHAAGFGINETLEPEQVEHFGIVTAEAMAAGAVPLVCYAGGQKEVLGQKMKDLGWHTKAELVTKTKQLITNPTQYTKWQALGLKQVKKFDLINFEKSVNKML